MIPSPALEATLGAGFCAPGAPASGIGPGGEPPTGGLATKSYHGGQKSAQVEGICTTAREAIRTCCTFPAYLARNNPVPDAHPFHDELKRPSAIPPARL